MVTFCLGDVYQCFVTLSPLIFSLKLIAPSYVPPSFSIVSLIVDGTSEVSVSGSVSNFTTFSFAAPSVEYLTLSASTLMRISLAVPIVILTGVYLSSPFTLYSSLAVYSPSVRLFGTANEVRSVSRYSPGAVNPLNKVLEATILSSLSYTTRAKSSTSSSKLEVLYTSHAMTSISFPLSTVTSKSGPRPSQSIS